MRQVCHVSNSPQQLSRVHCIVQLCHVPNSLREALKKPLHGATLPWIQFAKRDSQEPNAWGNSAIHPIRSERLSRSHWMEQLCHGSDSLRETLEKPLNGAPLPYIQFAQRDSREVTAWATLPWIQSAQRDSREATAWGNSAMDPIRPDTLPTNLCITRHCHSTTLAGMSEIHQKRIDHHKEQDTKL